MKRIFFALVLFTFSAIANAQVINPVTWTFTAKKTADKTYELHLTANIQSGWHMYSQNQPADAINIPTAIVFTPNPFLTIDGKAKEVGKMEKYKDARLGISANQYKDQVDFVQKVKLKGSAKTNVTGSVEFQTCDDKKCLPAKKVTFNLALK
ncbi:MAG TPA: protein-disulfide reductase DsbD domain-containing protein [Ferruginibacter sp.]|nr:protein-disulfide reductase DsbD domain-containing protein [Ferruginibacter sp.]